MFETLDFAPPDAILGLNEAFHKDPRPEKINLTVGVYQDERGQTPLLRCVKEAERRLLERETTKTYLPIAGLSQFGQHVRSLLFPADHEITRTGRAATLQTPGGTAALRVAADLLRRRFPQLTVWCSNPTWANHPAVFEAAGLPVRQYAYLDSQRTGLDLDAMLRSLDQIPAGDVVLLHAGCHNPTGIDPTADQWRQIADVVRRRRLLPLVDFAYQGFGDGLDEDAAGLRAIADACRELLIASSFSKNFSLYAERVGALTIVADTPDAAEAALSHAKLCARTLYSNPPKHGAAIVCTILDDAELRQLWQAELAQMRGRIQRMRELFVGTLSQKMPERDFSFLARQKGMFSYTGLTPLQVDRLRAEFAIYIVGSGRVNVAGMNEHNMDLLCDAIAAVLRSGA